MAHSLSVALISPELAPLAQTGGLGDMLHSLGPALHSQGVSVSYILPRYRQIARDELEDLGTLGPARILRGRHPSGIPIFFVDIPALFNRDGIYGEHAQDYPDNLSRFTGFARAAIDIMRTQFPAPDIIHCHDWPTALVPLLLRTAFANDVAFRTSRSIFTIHNLGYQGIFPASQLAEADLPPRCLEFLEYFGQINLLKGGILASDGITTVSPNYAREVLTPELGYGLDGVLNSRSSVFRGILNGINPHDWDPRYNAGLPAHYSTEDLSGKKICKEALQKQFGLAEDRDKLIIGMICRLAWQKGADLVMDVIPGLAHLPLQWVLLGNGDPALEDRMCRLAQQFPGQVSATIGFHAELSHLIEAGSDLFVMPSRYEPCGYNQMYSQRYGTLPIARATGGLKDTIHNITSPETGTGFLFEEATARALHDCILRAVQFCGNCDHKEAAMRRAMAQDFSWENSVRQFEDFYQEIRDHG